MPPLPADSIHARACKLKCEKILTRPPSLQSVVLCLDHDEPGQTAARRLQEELQGAGYHSGILLPVHKDWNDDLVQGQTVTGPAMTMGQSM